MGNHVIAGRDLTWRDAHTLAPVALISDNLAREYWKDPSRAVGRRIRRSPQTPWIEIVGVVGDDRQDGATKPAPSTVYWPILAGGFDGEPYIQRSLTYAIRSSRLQSTGFLSEVQRAVWSLNSNLPLARVRTLSQIYQESMAQTSFVLVILGIAASVTLLLGIVGIYGVIAYIVSQRRREIGIRMALGARSGEVQRMFIGRGIALAGVGLVVGLVSAAMLMRLLNSLLFGVSPFDPLTYAAVVSALAAVALVATWIPARHATKVDPMSALRAD